MIERGGRATTMSGQCRYFEQHAWKKEICTNCFKTREEHLGTAENSRPSIAKASANLKTDTQKLQSILRARPSNQSSRRKNVAFPKTLTEVIGYGGNDFSENDENNESDDPDNYELSDSGCMADDDIPDSEEERALGNLTRANTNFNTITANLTDTGNSEAKTAKSFASLMLGKVQKDSEGKKKTLLVSVTPFGADDTLPTAKRPSDKKSSSASTNSAKIRQDDAINAPTGKQENEKAAQSPKNLSKSSQKNSNHETKQDNENSGLEKIVDMPLITSSNLISVIQKSDTLTSNMDYEAEKTTEKGSTTIARCPAMKKPDSEKPKISLQASGCQEKSDYTITRITGLENSRLESLDSNGFDSNIDLTENPTKSEDNTELGSLSLKGKDINKIEVSSASRDRAKNIEDLEERTVVGEAGPEPILLANRRFSCGESRENAGEPDGKADEEEIAEPPALPRTLPPMDPRNSRNAQTNDQRITITEPRTSFLHGETRMKPAIPQKPMSLPVKPSAIVPKNLTTGGGASSTKNQTGDYVLPPPSVKNISSQIPGSGRLGINEKSHNSDSMHSFATNHSLVQASMNQNNDAFKTFQTSRESNVAQSSAGSTSKPPIVCPVAIDQRISLENSSIRTCDNSDRTTSSQAPVQRTELPKLVEASLREIDEDAQSTDDDSRLDISPESNAELSRSSNKRRMAPKPPATPFDELAPSIFARNPAAANLKSDSPVVREKEKRERASSCSPKFRKAISESPDPCATVVPEDSPRRTISLSQGSLANIEKTEEKKKNRPRFSLKRLLRMGTRKDVDMTCGGGTSSRNDEIPTTPQPKPRLEIIHPLELDGAAVEVLRYDRIVQTSEDVTDSKLENQQQSSGNHQHTAAATRPGKPPPPPRNVQTPDEWTRLTETSGKPIRPPPPRNEGKITPRSEKPIFSKTWQPSSSPSDSIYANLAAEDVAGEVRSGLAPSKPQRTASMRDQTIVQPPMKKRNATCDIANGNYAKEDSVRPPSSDSPTSSDSNAYECLSSSPECDSNLELRRSHGGSNRSNCKRKSDSSTLETCVGEFKYHQMTFARSTSLPYCGSETESELYAPYSFYTGDEGPEDDQDWKAKEEDFGMNRVRQRRGRSIVHRSLEDNYGAVIVANHEALAQLLERLNQPSPVPANLRSLKTANPRLNEMSVDTDELLTAGKKVFCSALWNEHAVTLCISLDTAMPVSRKEFSLAPIAEFVDIVPESISMKCFAGRKNVDASVSIFSRMQVNTMQSYAAEISRDRKTDVWTRESCFVLLQLVNALKNLQARGIEEAPKNLSNVVLCREDNKDTCYRLYLLQGLNADTGDDRDEERVSLCQCAQVALQELGLAGKLPVIRELLMRERAVTLSQVKSVLEFSLWGPSDATLGIVSEREIILQRWLDLERANVLHALVRTRAPLAVTDEYQLIFLVCTSARIMCEASVLLDEQQRRADSIRLN